MEYLVCIGAALLKIAAKPRSGDLFFHQLPLEI